MALKRLVWVDSLKGWLMLLVILGHAIQRILGDACNSDHIWNAIYSFHMPAFMAISGWLAYREVSTADKKERSLFSICQRRFSQLLIPFFIWSVVSFLCNGKYELQTLGGMILYPDKSYWFLWVLFWIYVVFNFAKLIALKLRINEMISILMTCLLLFGMMALLEIRIFGFQFLAYYFLFYTLGYCIHKYEDTAIICTLARTPYTIIFTILWAFLAWGWTMHGLPSWVPSIPNVPETLFQYAYRGLTALLAIFVLLGAAPRLLNGEGLFNQKICSIGVVSLGLYVVHGLIMNYVIKGTISFLPVSNTKTFIIVVFAITFGLSLFAVSALTKNKHVAKFFLGKL